MNTQLTANEVRRTACEWPAWRVGDMLHAFADLLEAREKAVPVYQHRSKNGPMLRWFDCSEETFMAMEYNEHDKEHFDRRILYTHPDPADAERLAEALRAIRQRVTENSSALARFIIATCDEALAAHSAQAQPPVQSEYAPPYPDQAQDPFWKVPGMVDTRPKAQPPAASVTDVMVERASRAVCQSGKFETGQGTCALICMGKLGAARQGGCPCEVRVHERLARLVLEAALAAQENPNG